MKHSKPCPHRLLRDVRAFSMVEFAIALPIFIIILLGTVEISNYVYSNQKLQNASYNLLNLINVQENISSEQLDSIARIVPEVVYPIETTAADYTVYITALQRDVGGVDPYVRWQHVFGAEANGDSKFEYDASKTKEENPVSGDALRGFTFAEGDQLIAVELFMRYTPLMGGQLIDDLFGVKNHFMYFFSSSRPRKGSFQFNPGEIR